MTGYASNTGTRRNLEALSCASWRILLTPDNPKPRSGLHYAIDNGAWKAFQQQQPFDEYPFLRLIERSGENADFVVIPDIVAGGVKSLEFSQSWIPRLTGLKSLLFPVQDGMNKALVANALREDERIGIFLGGSTIWKLETMYQWGELAYEMGRHYHVGRVNTARRIRLAEESGADSFDGTSATMFSKTLPLLESARRNRSLLQPSTFSRRCYL